MNYINYMNHINWLITVLGNNVVIWIKEYLTEFHIRSKKTKQTKVVKVKNETLLSCYNENKLPLTIRNLLK